MKIVMLIVVTKTLILPKQPNKPTSQKQQQLTNVTYFVGSLRK